MIITLTGIGLLYKKLFNILIIEFKSVSLKYLCIKLKNMTNKSEKWDSIYFTKVLVVTNLIDTYFLISSDDLNSNTPVFSLFLISAHILSSAAMSLGQIIYVKNVYVLV